LRFRQITVDSRKQKDNLGYFLFVLHPNFQYNGFFLKHWSGYVICKWTPA